MENKVLDILVVGAGPAGLSVGIAASKNRMSCLILDQGSVVNTIRRYPTYATFFSTSELLELDNLPFPSISKQPTRHEALRYYIKVAAYYKLNFQLYTQVLDISKHGEYFSVSTSKGTFSAKNVVVAIGYFEKYNALNVEGEELPHVTHYYSEAYHYTEQKVIVIGGSNSAAEAALDLYRNGAQVTIVHRQDQLREKIKYWIRPDLINRIKEGSIKAYFNSKVVGIKPESVELDTPDGIKEIEAQHVVALTGYHPEVSFLNKIGIEFDDETYVPNYNPKTFESNVKGLYLAGTVTSGKNTSKIFIENSRHHGGIIVSHISQGK